MCGFGVQEMSKTSVITKIYTQGCIQRIQGYVEQNLFVLAGIALGVALMQLLGENVFFTKKNFLWHLKRIVFFKKMFYFLKKIIVFVLIKKNFCVIIGLNLILFFASFKVVSL